MTEVQELARFVVGTRYGQLSAEAAEQLKIRVLDTIGVAIGALDAAPVVAIRGLTESLGGNGSSTLIGGGSSAPDRAAFYNTALSRYLDFMDSYLAVGETNHPSDNLGAVLAAAESVDASGRDFLTALACAYQVHTRLSDVAPVRAKGFDHTVQGAYAVAAGVSRALGLSVDQAANAMAIAGTANNALRVTRTGALSHWKGLAYPQVAKEGTHAALLASVGITGPAEVFEGNKGFKETIAGDFFIDWSAEDLERVRRTIVKKHNAEIHSQSTIDAAIEIAATPGFDPQAIRAVRVTTFQVAFDIIGGGEEGDKRQVRTKEEADHSLPYMVAVALLDRQVLPAQYDADRIVAADVQQLLTVVEIRPDAAYSKRFPDEMPTRVEVELADGTVLVANRAAYHGFHTDPLDWAAALAKFNALATPFGGRPLADQIANVISELEIRPVRALTDLLAQVPRNRHHEHAAATTVAPAHTPEDHLQNDGRLFMTETSFAFIPRAYRPSKPRTFGLTEVRGPYYSTYGLRHLADVLEVAGPWVDGVKWAGGSFALLPREQVRAFSDLAHEHDAYISSGGWIETVLRYGPDAVEQYLKEAKEVGFDVIEISAGFLSMPASGLLRLIEQVKKAGLKAKPELGIQFGSGGDSTEAELAAEGKKDVGDLVDRAKRALDAGADIIMIESEGITENVVDANTAAAASIINGVGLEHVMFEAADPLVFEWYIKNYGNEINLFVDHSQILQLEGLRQNIWGNKSTWGRIANPAPTTT